MFIIKKEMKHLLAVSIALVVVMIMASPLHAEGEYFSTEITANERALFAFFRASGIAPNYEYWIKSQPGFDQLSPEKQEAYLVKEMMRLGRGYGHFNLQEDILIIHTRVRSKFIPATEDSQAKMVFEFPSVEKNYVPSFDFQYGDRTVSLLINNLAAFSDIEMKDNQAKAVRKRAPFIGTFFDTDLEIHLRIADASTDKIIDQFDEKRWVMIGNVAYIKCSPITVHGNIGDQLWDYVAPWYEEEYRIKNMPEEEKYPHPYDLFKD